MSAGAAPWIDWATAEVEAGALSVALAGDRPKGWRRHFVAVLDVLDVGSGGWGRVRAKKDRIEVLDIHEGSEERLRQMLEGAVGQANADTHALRGGEAGVDESEDDPEAQHELADRRMTDTFRSFARRRQTGEPASSGA
ncbi:MAG TPA: hypothetical protein VFW29_07065 [Solirubrobacteraceae bacterium]|nr:hypothetical protein [Solirubrobacteraceae bacterium]